MTESLPMWPDGLIPKRKIVGISIVPESVESGAGVRCRTLEVPGSVGQCTQKRLDKTVSKFLENAQKITAASSSPNCIEARRYKNLLAFLNGEHDRKRKMITFDGGTLQILSDTNQRATSAKIYETLNAVYDQKCQKKTSQK